MQLFINLSNLCSPQGYKAEGNIIPRKEVIEMEHNLKISVSRKPVRSDVAALHTISLRERVLRFLFGRKQQITIIVPGDSVRELAICEFKEGDTA